jgi:hypothetical protein
MLIKGTPDECATPIPEFSATKNTIKHEERF